MKKLILASAAAFVLSAPLALAASTTTTMPATPTAPTKTHASASTPAEQCNSLGAQFDKAEATHKTNKNYKEALSLRSQGQSLCTAHKESDGIKKIRSALSLIGVKPMKS